jgi:hypothetical protein
VPADGTKAATLQNGDFGASPFFEQLSDKPQLACTCLSGLSDAKHNSRSRNYSLRGRSEQVEDGGDGEPGDAAA